MLDATRCISYLTIECKGADPGGAGGADGGLGVRLRHLQRGLSLEPALRLRGTGRLFRSRGALAGTDPELFERMDQAEFDRRFGDTPLARPGLSGMRRNVRAGLASVRTGAWHD